MVNRGRRKLGTVWWGKDADCVGGANSKKRETGGMVYRSAMVGGGGSLETGKGKEGNGSAW